MVFDNSYFEEEVRDGFYVPAEVKHAWAAELEVLSEVDKMCKKHNIQYFADWGTLLAAVRHEGFIPWDDDLDIVMKREDYQKFMKVANVELPKGYSAYNYNNHDDFWLFLARVVGKPRICFEDEHLRQFHEFPYIAGVDIFVLDYVSRDKDKEDERNRQALYLLAIADYIGEGHCDNNMKKVLLQKLNKENGIDIPFSMPNSKIRKALYGAVETLFEKFTNTDSDELTQLFPFGLKNNKFRFSKRWYDNSIELKYENMTIPVPVVYSQALKKRYGNYMKLVRNASGHDYPFFKMQKEQLQSVLDFDMPSYRFNPSMLLAKQQNEEGYKKSIKIIFDKLREMNESIVFKLNENNLPQEIITDLQSAQQWAIDIGLLIEKVKGEGTEAVTNLETYCELLYSISQILSEYDCSKSNDSLSEYGNKLKCTLTLVENYINVIEAKKDVVFVVYKSTQWKYIEHIWNKYNNDERYDVSVVVIPYYYKRYDGSYIEMVYEIDKFRFIEKECTVLDYDNYDVKIHRPDKIYIQNPYDEWNQSLTVPQDYYSSELRNYTKELIYIPPFELREFNADDYREYYNMQYYCTMPGVVNSDFVLVQSENMKQVYVQKLCDWAGNDTRHIWEKKIIVNEDAYLNARKYKQNSNELDKASIKDKRKKNIVFSIQISELISYKEKMLEKLKDVVNIFKENKNSINTIWVVDGLQEEYLENNQGYEQLKEDYSDIKKRFMTAGCGVCIKRSDYSVDSIADLGDAYYGCEGHIAVGFMMDNKPVMIMSIE